jgi:uncharacterized protein
VIAVDTNVLVMAHRAETQQHERALLWLRSLSEGSLPWALPFFCIAEFVRVVTHRKVFSPPSSLAEAVDAVDALVESPTVRVLLPSGGHWPVLRAALISGEATGNLVFDAQIAALCREHGVERLLTQDRDFSRFAFLSVVTLAADPGAA